MKRLFLAISVLLLTSGCSAIKQHDMVQGMTKDQVMAAWGEPREIKSAHNTCCKPTEEEAWYYYSVYKEPHTISKSVIFKDDYVQHAFVWR